MEHRTEPSARDICRLQKGDEALGSSAANELAARNLVAVQAKYDRLRENLGPHGLGYTLGRHRN